MTTPKIFKELEKYLSRYHIILLKLSTAVPRDIGICSAIQDIVKAYNDTQERENEVCELLANLCKNHFNKRK
jgi:hypothetical protein